MSRYRLVGSVLSLLLLAASSTHTETPSAGEEAAMANDGEVLGGIHDSSDGRANDLHIVDLARFAVSEHNNKANALLEFKNVVKVKEQVVAGTMYFITLEVKEGGATKLYEAKVWEKPWENFKELQEFKPADGGASA